MIQRSRRLIFIACGTSYHSALAVSTCSYVYLQRIHYNYVFQDDSVEQAITESKTSLVSFSDNSCNICVLVKYQCYNRLCFFRVALELVEQKNYFLL